MTRAGAAQARGSPVHTVRSQVKRILEKSGARSTRELIVRVHAPPIAAAS